MTSDWEYLSKAKKGDDFSAEYLFNKYYNSLIRMTALITGSQDTAKDIVQETFIKMIRKRVRHTRGNFKTYLTTVAYRLALKEKLRKNKITDLISNEIKDQLVLPSDKHAETETQEHLFKVVQSLTRDKKEILVLRFYGKLSYEEISEIKGVPIGTVKSRIFYAVKECTKQLKKQGIID